MSLNNSTGAFKRMTMTVFLVLFSIPALADLECEDAEILSSKLITDVCWDCMMPIRVSGVYLGGGSSEVPPDASDDLLCTCDRDNTGIPSPGFVTALWEPARLMEVVRMSGCSPSLGGVRLPLSDYRQLGSHGGAGEDTDEAPIAKANFHFYSFPLLVMLDLFTEGACFAEGYADFDIMYMSEIDPAWNNEALAFFTNPESAVVATPPAIMACAIDAMETIGDWPNDELFWCAGSWGRMYPVAGILDSTGSWGENTSHMATKGLFAMHRRGFAKRTMGDDTLCKAKLAPMLPKSQYKMSYMYPVPEAESTHRIGEPDFIWGAGRKIPGVGEEAVLLLWRWSDCCALW